MKVGHKPSASHPTLTSSAAVAVGPGAVTGIFVSAASSTPTIKLWDNATAGSGTVLLDQFTPVAGTMYSFPDLAYNNGVFITIGGTVTCNVMTRN
jgi:hypothetical protein